MPVSYQIYGDQGINTKIQYSFAKTLACKGPFTPKIITIKTSILITVLEFTPTDDNIVYFKIARCSFRLIRMDGGQYVRQVEKTKL